MRIASLLPAATDWVRAFGAADRLVACSHECDLPPGATDVPVVTRATYRATCEAAEDGRQADSRSIDAAVRSRLQSGLSLYEVDLDRLRAARPDVVLTQTQCAVCAVSRSQLEGELAGWAGRSGASAEAPRLLSLAPATLKEVFDAGLTVGRAIGCLDAAMAFLARQEKRLRALRDRLGPPGRAAPKTLPTVACVEWLEPLMTAGHWTPDLAAQAGARAVLSEKGARSRTVAWSALRRADPDVLAVMPCGFSMEETARDVHYLTERPGWEALRAVRAGRVVLFDGNAYFNRPGPRLYRSAELLAAALHPERARPFVKPERAEMRRLDQAMA